MRHRTIYVVHLMRWREHQSGHSNYIATPRLAQARYYAKKLPLKIRQIDVRIKGKKPFVLEGSWK